MTDFQKRTWVEIDLDALAQNMNTIRSRVRPETMIMGVVKADAYGHGSRGISLALQEQGAVSWFGVARLEEALELRDFGITLPILIFGITPSEYTETLLHYDLVPTVHTLDYAKQLQSAAAILGRKLPIHVKLDTGMSRMGFLAYDEYLKVSLDEITELCQLPNLIPQGLYTHFAVADTLDENSVDYTKEQFAYYIRARDLLLERGIDFPICHCSNSAAIVNYPEMNLDMVRAGIIQYGLHPDADCKPYIDLTPIMSFYTSVAMVKEIPIGRTVSYGREFCAQRTTKIANVGVGYADGYDRILSGRGEMILGGCRVPVLGRVCMDQLMLDVTDVPAVQVGDRVVIVGKEGGLAISFEDMATATGTIHYEKTTVIGKRVPRVYYKNGRVVDVTDLIRGRSHGFDGKELTHC